MTVARQMQLREHIKDYFDAAAEGETIFVPRKQNKNVVVISQFEYERMLASAKQSEKKDIAAKIFAIAEKDGKSHKSSGKWSRDELYQR